MVDTYDIYHDESKFDAYWHCFLFVPRSKRKILLELLQESRNFINFQSQVRFGNIQKKQKSRHGRVMIAKSWISILVASMQQQKHTTEIPKIYFGKLKNKPVEYREMLEKIGVKVVIFKERDNHDNCYFTNDPLRNIETTFRMGFKGGLHRLFPQNEKVVIGKLFIDGNEHYYGEYGRDLNHTNIIERLIIESRDHISFDQDFKIIPQKNDHRKIEENQDQDDSQLLQLCDLCLGSVRLLCLKPEIKDIRSQISLFCKKLLEYDIDNYARMSNSRFFNGFTFGEAWIEEGSWNFKRLEIYNEPDLEPEQSSLF